MTGLRTRFTLAEDLEATLEANPDSATPELLHAARAMGFNRLSLGVQSLGDVDLAALGRAHDVKQALRALRDARAAGFANIGLDLIFGLPGQTPEVWLAGLAHAVDLGPEHISCYGLTVEPGTPLAADAHALAALPDEDVQAEMFLRGSALLTAAGYEHYEISNFALPGRRCRHNLACWQGRDVLAFGPAAVSTMTTAGQAERWANPADLHGWAEPRQPDATGRGWREPLTPEIRAREQLMLALRTADGLDLAAHRALTGQDLVLAHGALLEQLARSGLVELGATNLKLTPAGMLVSNSVIRALGFESRNEDNS